MVCSRFLESGSTATFELSVLLMASVQCCDEHQAFILFQPEMEMNASPSVNDFTQFFCACKNVMELPTSVAVSELYLEYLIVVYIMFRFVS